MLQATLDDLHQAGARVIVCSQATRAHPDVPPAARDYLSTDVQHAQKIIQMGVYLRDTLQQFSHDNGIEFLDVYNEIPPNAEMLGDDIHLTRRGERLLASIWHRYLVDLPTADGTTFPDRPK